MRIPLCGFRGFIPVAIRKFFLCILLAALVAGSQSSLARASEYKLSAGDVLSFDILDDTDLPTTLTVTSDGDVQFPLIGSLNIVGLTIGEARDRIRSAYITRDIIKDPKIALNITTFRPIFVLGEVKNPGSFPYSPGLTVEQGVGLAGGTQTDQTNASDRVVARARLRGDIDGTQAELVHEAIYTARLQAQLQGKPKVDIKDVPENARGFVQNVSIRSVIEIEQKILDTDLATSKSQVDILSQGIVEAEGGLVILSQLEATQKEVVEANRLDFVRVDSLRKRELNTIAEWLRAKTSLSDDKARLLEIYAQMSTARRELGNLKLELAKLQADRIKDILVKLQERDVAIKKLIAERHSAEEQFFLMAAAGQQSLPNSKITFSYEIRRTVEGRKQAITAQSTSEVLPGDVLLVTIVGI
jgi:protein involved in polysaccharide export with SLBB domain